MEDEKHPIRFYRVMRNLALVAMIAIAIGICALGILAFARLLPYKTLTVAIFYALCLGGLAFLGVCVLFIGGLIAVVSGYAIPCRTAVLPPRGKRFFAYVFGAACVMFQLAAIAAVAWIAYSAVHKVLLKRSMQDDSAMYESPASVVVRH